MRFNTNLYEERQQWIQLMEEGNDELDYSSYIPDPNQIYLEPQVPIEGGVFDEAEFWRTQERIIMRDARDRYEQEKRDREPKYKSPWEWLKAFYQSQQDHSHGRGPK